MELTQYLTGADDLMLAAASTDHLISLLAPPPQYVSTQATNKTQLPNDPGEHSLLSSSLWHMRCIEFVIQPHGSPKTSPCALESPPPASFPIFHTSSDISALMTTKYGCKQATTWWLGATKHTTDFRIMLAHAMDVLRRVKRIASIELHFTRYPQRVSRIMNHMA
ncbi:uncharacterized protein VTP21DRAFT_6144 [Calcarisporiella thermophila]|uniref:uncharacterized protein n=1 Tax=Calcarisporiella thermophila TaxID=911321 RepID=UPI0037439824